MTKRILLAALAAVTALTGACTVPSGTEWGDVVDIGGEPSDAGGVVISEVMAENDSFVLGCVDDWVELYNPTDSERDLSAYSLTKAEAGSPVMTLEGLSVPAGGYTVIRLTDESPFRLPKEGGAAVLLSGGKAVSKLEFGVSDGRCSFTADGRTDAPTPGYPNDAEGEAAYLGSVSLPPVRINEVVSSNDRYAPVDGKYYDLVEIYNGSGSDVSLAGYWLSDKRSEPARYRFPDVVLPAGGYFVVYCSGKPGENMAPFKISSSGETLYLSTEAGFADVVCVPGDVPENESWGRNGASFVYIAEATPGAENAAGSSSGLGAPVPSRESGAYDEPFILELQGSGTVYYTLDGTKPDANSRVYDGGISIDGIRTVRAVCMDGGRTGAETALFYCVGIEHAFPIMNVTAPKSGLEKAMTQIAEEYEQQSYVTLLENGEVAFSVPCGFKLHGNDSKKGEKQNFQLRFRSEYGLSKLEYPVFGNRSFEKYNSLILKGGSEDFVFCGFRDELCTSIVDGATELAVQAYRPVILYLNGEYRGIYWLRERIDAEFCAQRMGVSDDSVNLLKDFGEAVVKGSGAGFKALSEYCATHDLKNEADYKYVLDRIDYVSMMDWYICRSYMGDTDLANIRMYSSDEADGKWHWCFFDLDWALWNDTEDPIGKTARNDGHHTIMTALLKNPDFRDKFLKRYAHLMQTVLNERTICAKADEFVELMEPEIAADREMYGSSVSLWKDFVAGLKGYVKDGKRDRTVLRGIRNYFGLSESQMIQYFGRAE